VFGSVFPVSFPHPDGRQEAGRRASHRKPSLFPVYGLQWTIEKSTFHIMMKPTGAEVDLKSPFPSSSSLPFPTHSSLLHLAFWIASLLHSVSIIQLCYSVRSSHIHIFKMRTRTVTGILALGFGLSEAVQLQDTPDSSPQSSSSCPDPSLISLAQSESVWTCLPANGHTDLGLFQSLGTLCSSTPRTRQSRSPIKTSRSALIPLVVSWWKTRQHSHCLLRIS
jgi:hypothetical protein